MSSTTGHREQLDDEAAAWVVRLQSDALDEHDGAAFDAWLSASPAHRNAYDEAVAVWRAAEDHAPQIRRALTIAGQRRVRFSRRVAAGLGFAAAATVAVAVLAPTLHEAPAQAFATGKGEMRTVRLEDGSTVSLNAGTQMTVRMMRKERRISLARGEAVFDVAADSRRPFYVEAGDHTVRVVGTQFDVRRRGGSLSVTVGRGLVEVGPTQPDEGRTVRLYPGQRLDRREGGLESRVSGVEPAEVFSWRARRLVYRDQPLSEVVADLNEQFMRPIRLADPRLGEMKISGVLILDDQDAVIRRLALLGPITAVASKDGVSLRRNKPERR